MTGVCAHEWDRGNSKPRATICTKCGMEYETFLGHKAAHHDYCRLLIRAGESEVLADAIQRLLDRNAQLEKLAVDLELSRCNAADCARGAIRKIAALEAKLGELQGNP